MKGFGFRSPEAFFIKMINIDNTIDSEFTIPVSNADGLDFTFVHHLSGVAVLIDLVNQNTSPSESFRGIMPAFTFKYNGLHSFIAKVGLEEVYIGLSSVSIPKQIVPKFNQDSKDYALYE